MNRAKSVIGVVLLIVLVSSLFGGCSGFELSQVEGRWGTESINGVSLEDFAKTSGLTAEEANSIWDISGESLTATSNGVVMEFKITKTSNGFEILNPEDSVVLFVTHYDAKSDKITYEIGSNAVVVSRYENA